MPIFEYSCNACRNQFEKLVRGTSVLSCPECGSADLEKLFSLPAVKSDTTRDLAMRAAKRRDKQQGTDRVEAQRYYEAHHDD